MKTMKLANEGREETFVAKSCQPSIDSCSNLLIQLPLEDNKMSPLENDADAESEQAPTNISERKLLSVENDDNQFELVSTDQLQSGEAGNNLQGEQSSPEVSEFATKDISEPNVPSEDLVLGERVAKVPNQLRRNSPESYVSSPDLVGVKQASPEVSKQLREDTYEPYVSSVGLFNHVDDETECVQASQEYFKEFEVQQQPDQEPEQDLKPFLLENLSLNTRNDEFLESVPSTSHKCETPEETSMSNRSFLESSCDASPDASFYNPLSTQASARTNIEAINTSSPTSHLNLIRRQPLGQPQITPNIGGNWHQKNTTDRVRRRSKFGFRGNSQRKQRQESPQHYPQAEMDAQTPMSQGYSNQPLPPLNVQVQQSNGMQKQYQAAGGHTNLTAHNPWPRRNVQQQSFAPTSESQLPAPVVALQTPQYSTQSDGQLGNMQNSQTYSQMWQYYCYQQQQFLLQQQLQLQLQQQPQNQPQQQQYQQQLQVQQHYHDQQQQQLEQLQQQQLQYNQQQQFQLQQQFLQQQQPLHQQQQRQQPLQQQRELEQKEHQQQNSPSEIEA